MNHVATTAQQPIEIVRDAYERFNEGDVDAVLASFDEDVEWTEPDGSPYRGTHRGPEAVLENVFGPSMEEYEDLEIAVERFVDGDGTVVVLGTFNGADRGTDESVEIPFAHVCDVVDGKLIRFEDYIDTAVWQRARGT